MNISSPFIARPIATALLMAGLLLAGLAAYPLLPVAALPNINYPTLQVTVQLPGADPQTMASSVATPLELQFGQIPGLIQMTSASALGFTQITLQFDLNRAIDGAATDTLSAINAAAAQLPLNIPYPPTIRRVNPADTPILVLGVTSDTLPLTTVDAYAETILLEKISQISGVGLVGIGGQQKPAVRVQVDPQALAARGIGLEDVRNVISQANVDQPKGTLNSPRQTYTINTNDQLLKPGDYDSLILAYRNGSPVRVRDVGKAIDGPENDLIAGWYNHQRAIILAIQRQPGANVVDTVERVKAMLPVLQASIPSAIKVNVISDRTETIRASVNDVQFTLLLTVALVVMVIFLFLRDFWATIIPAVTVPLSLVGTFAVLYELGYTLDNLSLMALSIAVGFVVDDAVVVIENIVRHLEEGASPLDAALKGAGEIGFTIISITLSLIAVFIPLFLMSGYIGLLFREFAVTVSVALVLSLLISLTLTPMMCARLLKSRSEGHGRLYRLSERGFDGLLGLYEAGLKIVLRYRFATLMVMLGTIVLTGYLYVVIPNLSAARHRADPRPVRGRAGHLLFGHGRAPASPDRRGAGGSCGRFDRFGNRRWRRHHHGQQRPRLHRAQAPRPARRQRGPSDPTPANAARPHPRDHSLHASCPGYHHRRTTIQDSVSVHIGRRRPQRAQSLGAPFPRQDQGHSGHHRCHHRSGECRTIA
jgi:multidrug efflux pump subunit AcrB